ALAPLEPGEVVKVMIERDDEMIVLDVTLGEHPEINENKVIEKHIEIIVERDGTEESPDLSIDLPKLQLNQFEAYPNPNKGLLTVKFRGEAEPTVITISDIAGKSVYKEALSTFDGNYNKEISLSKFAKGTLLLIIEQGGKRFTEKIVHQ
ncbi:MAG: T9SS type A sorting domain-containing protein, partial [Saprospiraceae bacterium]|nr:T9SS type A sorting domain-containing protein [Saprospiraceae bacterium]